MNRLSAVLLSSTLLAGAAGCRNENAAAAPADPPPPTVTFVALTPEQVAVTGEWIATLDGNVNAQIRPQVSGYLVRRAYREGAFVRKGEVLFEIDRRPFEAALAQAQARLAEAQAQLAKTERDLARDQPLAEQRAIAQSQLDNDVSAHDAAQAAVSSAKAAVEAAELNLGFTRVTSLIDGVAAIASAQIGDLVGPTTLLTTVSQLNPIKAYFPLSEQEYLGIAGQVATPASTARALAVERRADACPRRRQHVPATRHRARRRSRGRSEDGHDPHQRAVPESRQRAAARAVRPRPRADRRPQGGSPRAAARGDGAPERTSGPRR